MKTKIGSSGGALHVSELNNNKKNFVVKENIATATCIENDATLTEKEKIDAFAYNLRKIQTELIEADQAYSTLKEKYDKLKERCDKLKLAEEDPITFIMNEFAPKNRLAFRYDNLTPMFKHIDNEKGRWYTLDEYRKIEEKVSFNPTKFCKKDK